MTKGDHARECVQNLYAASHSDRGRQSRKFAETDEDNDCAPEEHPRLLIYNRVCCVPRQTQRDGKGASALATNKILNVAQSHYAHKIIVANRSYNTA